MIPPFGTATLAQASQQHDQEAAMTLSDTAARITGEGAMAKYTGGGTSPTRDEIARLAYDFFERRGRQDGHDIDDWLSAERELARHYR